MSTYIIAWPTLGIAIFVFGFAPGVALRLIVLLYPRDNPRRREMIGELYAVPRIERPFWVAEQFEIALFEGLGSRFSAWRAKRTSEVNGRIKQGPQKAMLRFFSANVYVDLLEGDVSKIWLGADSDVWG